MTDLEIIKQEMEYFKTIGFGCTSRALVVDVAATRMSERITKLEARVQELQTQVYDYQNDITKLQDELDNYSEVG